MDVKIRVGPRDFATVDDGDVDLVANFSWFKDRRYAATKSAGKKLYMHRLIAAPPSDKVVDHINGDGLDNRRANLRVCSQQDNLRNNRGASKREGFFKGVYLYTGATRSKPWTAEIRVSGRKKFLGYFATPEEAARAYDAAAVNFYGEFALTNKSLDRFKQEQTP